MKALAILVVFFLYIIFYSSFAVLFSLVIAHTIELFWVGASTNQYGANAFGGLIIYSFIFVVWVSFKSTKYSDGKFQRFYLAVKLTLTDIKYYFTFR